MYLLCYVMLCFVSKYISIFYDNDSSFLYTCKKCRKKETTNKENWTHKKEMLEKHCEVNTVKSNETK